MAEKPRRRRKATATVGVSGLAGAGGGIGLLKYFQSLTDTSSLAPYKNELILVAPALSIIISWLTLYVIVPLAICVKMRIAYKFGKADLEVRGRQLSELMAYVERSDITEEQKQKLHKQIKEQKCQLIQDQINAVKEG